MRSYGQFCPVAKAAELFCERWTALIIRDLGAGSTRFSEIQRGVPLMSPSLLTRRLRALEAEGVVERRGEGRGASYHLTPAGQDFVPIVAALGVWGRRWTRRALQPHEIDLDLLIWTLEGRVDGSVFAEDPAVIRLELIDQPAHKRFWWFLHEKGGRQLCVSDPGFETTLYAACSLPDIIGLVLGDVTVRRAEAEDRLELIGNRAARMAFEGWLNLSALAAVPPG